MAYTSNNKTSILVSSQLPAFVREEHDRFVKFLEYYYKFLEQDGQQLYVAKNFPRYLDVDQIYADIIHDEEVGEPHSLREVDDYHAFLQKMYDIYIKYIPDAVLADKNLILKHAKQFYRSTGSEKSIRFLIQALFNKPSEFYYPKNDVLRTSDGKWFVEKSIKVTNVAVDNVSNSFAAVNFANTFITGASSKATAIVEKVDTYFEKGELVYELKLSGINREFLNSETVYTRFESEGATHYLNANIFSGVITLIQIVTAGSGYSEGATVPIVSNTGSGAQIVISKVSKGSIQAAGIINSGAGFQVDNPLLIYGSGSGAAGYVSDVDDSGFYHPNSYNVMWTTIGLEANTAIGNSVYSNLNSLIVDPANDSAGFVNSMSYFVYANCGPAYTLVITSGGTNYVPPISMTISANSIISKMGILGKMQIINGGLGYTGGDRIEFIDTFGSTGSGAIANVTNVAANGMITEIKFEEMPGHIIGGQGYDWNHLPIANVVSAGGSGANIAVTAIIGHNEEILQSVSDIGSILGMTVISGGGGYEDDTYLDLTTMGDGTANAKVFTVSGVYSYPGRFINDDGLLSSTNFLQDRDYYQEFSYVVRAEETINRYRDAVKDLAHPAGMKLFGQYLMTFDLETDTNTNVSITFSNTDLFSVDTKTLYQVQGFTSGVSVPNSVYGMANAEFVVGSFEVNTSNHLTTYAAQNNSIVISYENHGFYANDYVFLKFEGTNTWSNLGNTNYVVSSANLSHFSVINSLTEKPSGNTGNVRVYNPDVTIRLPHSGSNTRDNVYIQFQTVDPSLVNAFYTVTGVMSVNTFNVLHPNMTTANDSANVANVINKKIVVTANNHGYSVGNTAYLLFLGGDTGNTHNGYYVVSEVTDANSFNIVSPNVIFAGSTAKVHQKYSTIVMPGHPYANGNTVYIAFASGDQANTTNGLYQPVKMDSNRILITANKPAASNSNVRVWYQSNSYSNIKFTTLHDTSGYSATDNVYIEFYSGASDLSNGVYMVKDTYNGNTYNIYYDSNTSIVNAESIYGSQVYIPSSTNGVNTIISNTINTINHYGLGIVANSVMEGIAYVLPYK